MRKSKARIEATDSEIDSAIEQAKRYERYRPRATSATYRARGDVVAVKLDTGVQFIVPRKLLQGLENATPRQLADIRVVDAQSGLHWEALDVDHYIPSLIEGIFGNRRWMSEIGKKGGRRRTVAKAAAARANGRKGGRPPDSSRRGAA